jgi:hypothetical protein
MSGGGEPPSSSLLQGDPATDTDREPFIPIWLLLLGLGGVVCFSVWWFSYPGAPPGDGAAVVYLFVILAWVAALGALLAAVASLVGRRQRTGGWLRWRGVVAGLVLAAAGLTLSTFALPLRFSISRGALEDVALAVDSRRQSDIDGAGLYDVLRVDRRGAGVVFVVTHRCDGTCGFVYSPDGDPAVICGGSEYERYQHLRGLWYTFEWFGSDAGCRNAA